MVRARAAVTGGGAARACSGGITNRLTLYASITDSRQKHAEWNANEPASVAPRWKPRNQKIDSAIEWDHPERVTEGTEGISPWTTGI